jgi:hypothetical protein
VAAAPSTTGPPDFVGVGTQRSGTTWWFETLLEHPGIRAPRKRRKELHFFDRFNRGELGDADVAAYHELFPREPGELVGEWTPRYMHDFWTPRLLARAAPDAKLLILFRDPIERFRSGLPHRMGRTPDHRMETIVGDALERGRYASQLRRLRTCHPAASILILQYERCVADPAGQYERTLRHLGADPGFTAPSFDKPRGTTQAAKKEPLPAHLMEGLVATLEPEVAQLAATCPEIDVSLWPNFTHLAGPSGAQSDRAVSV